jgi:hypothetical protein
VPPQSVLADDVLTGISATHSWTLERNADDDIVCSIKSYKADCTLLDCFLTVESLGPAPA